MKHTRCKEDQGNKYGKGCGKRESNSCCMLLGYEFLPVPPLHKTTLPEDEGHPRLLADTLLTSENFGSCRLDIGRRRETPSISVLCHSSPEKALSMDWNEFLALGDSKKFGFKVVNSQLQIFYFRILTVQIGLYLILTFSLTDRS